MNTDCVKTLERNIKNGRLDICPQISMASVTHLFRNRLVVRGIGWSRAEYVFFGLNVLWYRNGRNLARGRNIFRLNSRGNLRIGKLHRFYYFGLRFVFFWKLKTFNQTFQLSMNVINLCLNVAY